MQANDRRDRGQAAIELMGMIPLLGLALIAALQLIFAVVTVQATSTAARAAARTISQGADPVAAAERAVPDWVENKMTVRVTGGSDPGVEVTTRMPVLLPGIDGPRVTRRAWFDAEHGRTPWG
jgi:Flp pilus assembly protein TadG